MLDCKLIDLGSKGHPFTWCNRQFGPLCIEEKIDRFFCNEEWRTEFHDDVATNLIHWESDYCPVMMEVRERQRSLVYERRNFNRIYCEDMWSRYEECQNIVKYEWLQWHITTEINLVLRFKTIGKRSLAQMKWWSKEEFGGRDKKLKELMRKLKRAKESNLQYENGNEIRHIERQIQNFLLEEEMYWKQRSRADWLKGEDKNTKFFHAKASARRRKNRIEGIEDRMGNWLNDKEEVEKIFCEYFQDLFTTSNLGEA